MGWLLLLGICILLLVCLVYLMSFNLPTEEWIFCPPTGPFQEWKTVPQVERFGAGWSLLLSKPSGFKYWQFDIYTGSRFLATLPMYEQVTIGKHLSWFQAKDCRIFLRAAGPIGEPVIAAPLWRQEKPPLPLMPIHSVDENPFYPQAQTIYDRMEGELLTEGLAHQLTIKSKWVETEAPLLHTETIQVHLEAGEEFVYTYTSKAPSPYTVITVSFDGKVMEKIEPTVPIEARRFKPPTRGLLTVTQHCYGLHADSQFLPLYGYVFGQTA